MTDSFKILKKSYHIKNIYCCIDINNIEKYLKRIENLEKQKNGKITIILVPDKLIFNENHLNWAVFIAKSRFSDKINISKSLFIESLMILSCTNQIKGVFEEWYLKEGKNNYFLTVLSEGKANYKKIIKDLSIIENKENHMPNFEKIIKVYNLKDKKNIENKIIEKMALSLF